ncbi:hypothetical protein TNCV_4081351 [Trichonephila clavipes]|nr:hypothetical protein TNCV_4081351 [Trichonephila clavipes]
MKIYLLNVRAWFLNHLTPSLPLQTDVISPVFIESSALEQVVIIHPGIATKRLGLISSQTKPVEVPRDRPLIGQGSPWLSKILGVLDFCSSEGKGDFRLRRFGSLLGFLVSSVITGDPRKWLDCKAIVQPYEMRSVILVLH